MRRFLITSSKFEGQAELVYNDNGTLAMLNLRKAVMSAEMIDQFKRAVAADVEKLSDKFTADTTIIEADFEITLDDFKREYPYSRNYHLLDDIWKRMSKSDQVKAYFAAIEYRRYCAKTDWYKAKIAASWLQKKEWMNDWRKM